MVYEKLVAELRQSSAELKQFSGGDHDHQGADESTKHERDENTVTGSDH